MLAPVNINEASAQDASFGCKVLLCAAAAAPGWAAIPYCVPVMQELFRQLAFKRPWPVCLEASKIGIGYEPPSSCPAGLTPARDDDGASSQDGDVHEPLPQQVCGSAENASWRATYPAVARTLRSHASFVDMRTNAGVQRSNSPLKDY
ncbi:hypothetical protein [uncultured Enterovirga sp.]|uniref:hypothetical protein n=1 Tax=uncultured Enterovirga sp. TaxID=2026352 RepID=UPI0035CCA4F4